MPVNETPLTEPALLRRVKPAVLPARYQFHRVFDQRLMDVCALGAFKGPQIGPGRTRIDPSQYHAPALTLRTAGTLNRKERWFGAGYMVEACVASLVWFRWPARHPSWRVFAGRSFPRSGSPAVAQVMTYRSVRPALWTCVVAWRCSSVTGGCATGLSVTEKSLGRSGDGERHS